MKCEGRRKEGSRKIDYESIKERERGRGFSYTRYICAIICDSAALRAHPDKRANIYPNCSYYFIMLKKKREKNREAVEEKFFASNALK